ncbi:MAG TPA: hypothetical protein VG267_10875 [Terracidiphilus sp.]|jgi:hypothetical protein|nr:hypothetical protein [Terracidiphilus sp.]
MPLSEKLSSVRVRELQLRRETLAAMKMRGSLPDRGRTCYVRSDLLAQATGSRAGQPLALRVLSISDYDGLRLSRELLLTQAGYSAESHSSSSCLDVLATQSFQIAILCHSVAPELAARIAEMLHCYHPRIRVLRLHSSERNASLYFDRELDCFSSPEELLRVLSEETHLIAGRDGVLR